MKRKLQPKLLSLFLSLLLLVINGYAQNATVTGTVTSAKDGLPLQGVTVGLQNSVTVTVTDEQGKYRITVPGLKGVLTFSYTGMATLSEDVNNRTIINVALKGDDNALTEVVVTAFGIERQKKALGYAAQVVAGKELTEARETNVANSLKGKVAGVFVSPSNTGPGGSTFINIRGSSSFLGNNQPLYVVDGVPIDNQNIDNGGLYNSRGRSRDYGDGIGNILPDDIETITVLKGPNAAALYGARGATGVVLITTKKGKAGRGSVIDFNSNVTFETPNVVPTYQNVWGGGYDDNYSALFYDTRVIDGKEVPLWPSWLSDNWGGKYDGREMALERWPEAGILKYTGQPGDDNIKKFYQTGNTFTNTIGVSGGSDKGNYRISVSDLRNRGIYPTSKLDRQTINFRIGYNVTPQLYVEGKMNYIRQHGKNRIANGLDINNLQPSLNRFPLFIDLDMFKDYKNAAGEENNYVDGRPFNPYWILYEMPSNDSRDRLIGYVLARYKFTNWLTLQARSGTDFYTDNRFSRVAFNTPTPTLQRGQVNNTEIHVKEENSDVLLTASGNLSDKFTGSLSVGANHLNRVQEYSSLEGQNLNIPGLYNIINAGLVFPYNSTLRKQMNSVYFTGQVGYKDFLFVDVSGRNDWSSTLGENNYSFFYPSVSTSFIFSDALKINPSVLSYGKLRVSYAQAGNDASPYQTMIGYSLSSSTFAGQQFAGIRSDVPLTDLKNELTGSFEIGTELKFFHNRLGIDVTYYSAATKNQILPINISAATGFGTKLINAGKITNKGIEILLTGTPVQTSDFSWDMTLNFSRNRSQVVSLAPGISTISLISTGEISIEARPGQAYGNLVGYGYRKNEDGDRWLNSNGVYQRDDTLSVLGNFQPDFLAGVMNAFTYKGFTVRALIDIRKGGQIFSYSKLQQWSSGTGKGTENGDNLVSDGVIQGTDGKFTKSDVVVGRMNFYTSRSWGNIGEEFVLPADYVSLREVSIGYNVGSFFKKSFLKTAKLSVVGRNLLYIYRDPEFKLMGVSPEAAFGPFTTAQGFESPGPPSTRSVGINLSVTL